MKVNLYENRMEFCPCEGSTGWECQSIGAGEFDPKTNTVTWNGTVYPVKPGPNSIPTECGNPAPVLGTITYSAYFDKAHLVVAK